MGLPRIDDVDVRLAVLLDEFAPAEVTARQRAEDLVAAALTMYGGAFRRMRELAEQHDARRLAALWSTREPLAGLLALHRADSPAPPPTHVDDVRRSTATIEGILDELDSAPGPVGDRTAEMLAIVSDLHEAGLAQITGAIDDELRPDPPLLTAMGRDHLVASVLLIHGLHPEPVDTRLGRVLHELDQRAGAVASVTLMALTDDGAHLRVTGASPNDAYRLRLDLERTLAERVPDLPVAGIDGGAEPVRETSVLIPVESVTVRRSSKTDVGS